MTESLIENPTLSQIINGAIESRLADLHVSIPGKIVSFDGIKATVQPELKRKFADDTIVDLPPIVNVPVSFLSTNSASVTLPLKAGDTGLLIFSERSLDKWLVAGGPVNPDDVRKFDLSDGVFFPGAKPFNQPSDYDPARIVIKNVAGKMTVNASGLIAIGNGVTKVELLSIVDQLIDQMIATETAIAAITVNTVLGTSSIPNNAPVFVALGTAITAIKTQLGTIKDILV